MEKSDLVWCPLEANPAVLEKYVQEIGGPSHLVFRDVFSTEEWALDCIERPVLAVLLVYPITPVSTAHQERLEESNTQTVMSDPKLQRSVSSELWFTRQTVSNACGTVALLHTFGNLNLLNNILKKDGAPGLMLKPNGLLEQFYASTHSSSPEEKAAALGSSALKLAHSRAADTGQSTCSTLDVNEHYVVFLPFNDTYLVELDGRKTKPVFHVKESEDFLKAATRVIQSQYISIDPSQMRFSMLAMCAGLESH